MASVTMKDEPGSHSPFWQAKIKGLKDERGKVKVIWLSTKLVKEREALKLAEAWEGACRDAESGKLTQDKAAALIDKVRAEYGEKQGKITEKLVSGLLKAKGRELGGRNFEAWCEDWLSRREGSTSRSTIEKYKRVVESFLRSLPQDRRIGPIDQISGDDVQAWIDKSEAKGVAAQIRKTILHGVFEKARVKRFCVWNPVDEVEVTKRSKAERIPFDSDSVRRLIAVADKEWTGCILFGFQAGLRICDAANLRWNDIDLQERTVTFTARKTNNEEVKTLHSDLVTYLIDLKSGDDPQAPLFPHLCDRPSSGRQGLSAEFGKLMKKAKIDPQYVELPSGREFPKLSFHSLRHATAARLHHAGVSEETRMEIVGHASKAVHKGYTHPDQSQQRGAMNLLDSVLPEK
jgi:integrase